MPSKKKTRKQKMISDLRRKNYSDIPTGAGPITLDISKTTIEPQKSFPSATVSSAMSTQQYAYIIDDLKKIILLTVTIVTMQLILFFLIK